MESLPIKYFDTHAHGDIMSVYTNDVDTLRQLLSQSIPQLINSSFTMVATLITMIIMSPALTVVSVLAAIAMFTVTKNFSRLSGKYFVKQQRALGEVERGPAPERQPGQPVLQPAHAHQHEHRLAELRPGGHRRRHSGHQRHGRRHSGHRDHLRGPAQELHQPHRPGEHADQFRGHRRRRRPACL